MASSAGFRPVDLRFLLAASALQRLRLTGDILPFLAMRTDGVGGGNLLPFPAAQGRAEDARARDDAPLIGRRVAHGNVDAADAHRLLADFEHDLAVGGFIDDGVPRAPAQDVGNVVEAAGPPAGTSHER